MRKLINIICIIIPVIAFFIILGDVTTEVPVHFNAAGVPDRYGSKYMYLLFVIVPVLLIIGNYYLSKKQILSENNIKQANHLITYLIIFFAYISIIMMQAVASESFTHANYLVFGFGALFAVIGNSMNKLEQNKFIGIRIPATLNDEQVWNRTHRRAGWIFTVYGIIVMIASPLITNPVIILLGFVCDLFIILGYIVYYSRKIKKEVEGK